MPATPIRVDGIFFYSYSVDPAGVLAEGDLHPGRVEEYHVVDDRLGRRLYHARARLF
jgi:hypothetical protein